MEFNLEIWSKMRGIRCSWETPMKGVVLAGGLGTRLNSLTKVMYPEKGKENKAPNRY